MQTQPALTATISDTQALEQQLQTLWRQGGAKCRGRVCAFNTRSTGRRTLVESLACTTYKPTEQLAPSMHEFAVES